MSGTGRNDPCPCGSGKKFKHCCLTRTQTATGITPRDRTDAFAALMKYSRRDEFESVVADAAREWAGHAPDAAVTDALEDIFAFETAAQAFFDWLFFDVHATDGGTIADAFLAAREWTVSRPAADYIRLMRGTSLRLYQVRRVDPGNGLHVRDLWTKDDLMITERLGSSQLVKWDVLAARIVSHTDGTHQIEGAVMALPPHASKPLIKELKADYREFALDQPDAPVADFFKEFAPMIYDVWVDEVAMQEEPSLVTPEGDSVTVSIILFDVPEAGIALAALLQQPDFDVGEIAGAVWVEGEGDRRRILGEVQCDTGTLTLMTFSKERAARGRQRLETILGPLAVRYEEHREFDRDETGAEGAGALPDLDVNDVPELQVWLREQDRQWLDTPVPALDGRTPREAAADKRLRSRLRALLVDIENQEARISGSTRDLGWMWRDLGLRRP